MTVIEYLRSCRELSQLCRQNGWIDNETLIVSIEYRDKDSVVASVTFDEVIMEGGGCVADRVQRWGKIRLALGPGGNVLDLVSL